MFTHYRMAACPSYSALILTLAGSLVCSYPLAVAASSTTKLDVHATVCAEVQSGSIEPDSEFTLLVNVPSNLLGLLPTDFNLGLAFDPDQVEIVSVDAGDLGEVTIGTEVVDPITSLVNVSLSLDAPDLLNLDFTPDLALVTIRVKPGATGELDLNLIGIDGAPLLGGALDLLSADLCDITLSVAGLVSTMTPTMSPEPTPTIVVTSTATSVSTSTQTPTTTPEQTTAPSPSPLLSAEVCANVEGGTVEPDSEFTLLVNVPSNPLGLLPTDFNLGLVFAPDQIEIVSVDAGDLGEVTIGSEVVDPITSLVNVFLSLDEPDLLNLDFTPNLALVTIRVKPGVTGELDLNLVGVDGAPLLGGALDLLSADLCDITVVVDGPVSTMTPTIEPSPTLTATMTLTATTTVGTTTATPVATTSGTPSGTASATPTPSASPSTVTPVETSISSPTATPVTSITVTPSPTTSETPTTATITPTPFPTVEITFDESDQDWTFINPSPPFGAAAGGYMDDDGRVWMRPSTNVNSVSFYESPNFTISDGGGEYHINGLTGSDSLYRVTMDISTDKTGRTESPVLRVRSSSGDFQRSDLTVYTPLGDAILSPSSSNRSYMHYFVQPTGVDTFRLDYDQINVFETSSPDPTVLLDRVMVESLDQRDLKGESDVMNIVLNEETNPGWSALPESATLQLPQTYVNDPRGLRLGGIAGPVTGNSPETIFGFWGSDTGKAIDGRKLYKISATVESSAQENESSRVPSFRFRINDSSLRYAALVNIDSANPDAEIPTAGSPVTYDLFVDIPEEIADGTNTWVLSFDYLFTNDRADDPSVEITLKSVSIVGYDPELTSGR